MRVAIVGSRNLSVDISNYIPKGVTEIVTGGAKGIDTLAEAYADAMNIAKRVLKPEYRKYGRAAPIRRNEELVDLSDYIVAIWDGESRGTKHAIDYAMKADKPMAVYIV